MDACFMMAKPCFSILFIFLRRSIAKVKSEENIDQIAGPPEYWFLQMTHFPAHFPKLWRLLAEWFSPTLMKLDERNCCECNLGCFFHYFTSKFKFFALFQRATTFSSSILKTADFESAGTEPCSDYVTEVLLKFKFSVDLRAKNKIFKIFKMNNWNNYLKLQLFWKKHWAIETIERVSFCFREKDKDEL